VRDIPLAIELEVGAEIVSAQFIVGNGNVGSAIAAKRWV